MNISVVGLGWMGLPISLAFAGAGHKVVGYDINQELVDSINKGQTARTEQGLVQALATSLANGSFRATADPAEALKDADVISIIVPLLIKDNKLPDYSVLEAATKTVAQHMKDNALVIVNTTMPIGGTREKIKPILDASGKKYALAYSPIRAMSGTAMKDMTENYARVVGGIDEQSADRAAETIKSFLRNSVIKMHSLEDAEAVKLFEVIYRDTNIALANELALICEHKGLNYKRIKAAANSCKYYHLHDTGVGVGGHCLPVYPYLLLSVTDADKGLIKKAREVNDFMPQHVADIVLSHAPKTVGILGAAYRPNTSEHRFSPAKPLCNTLKAKGVRVLVNDPHIPEKELSIYGEPASIDDVCKADAVVLVTAHNEYTGLENKFSPEQFVADGRAFFNRNNIKSKFYCVGSKLE